MFQLPFEIFIINTAEKKEDLKAPHKNGPGATSLKLSEIFPFLTWLQHYLLEREAISNYDEDQQKKFENDQELTEDTIADIKL